LPSSFRRALAKQGGGRFRSAHPKSIRSKLGRFARTMDQPPATRYSGYMRLFDDVTIHELLAQPVSLHDDLIENQYDELLKDRDAVQAALAHDRETYLPDDLLVKTDRASMLHALEVRCPFMDHELVQSAAGLSTAQLLGGGPKRMLREAFAADLPTWVFKRKKMGFAVPIGQWFRGQLRSLLHDTLFAADSLASSHFNRATLDRLVQDHDASRADHSQRLYALLMLELWHAGLGKNKK
jgi:asparagine synthase (glutamine-hydrolysing)